MAKKPSTATKIGGGFVLLLLIVAMAGFGIEGFGTATRSIGSVGNKDISTDDYARALQEQLRELTQQTGQPVTLEQARAFGIDQSVLRQLVTRATLDNEAAELGLSVGDEIVQREILSIDGFQGLDGSFDRESYRFALQNAGLSESAFEEQLRADAARGILQTAVVAGIPAPATQRDLLLEFAGERRDLTVLTLDRRALAEPIPAASDADLRAFHEENIDRYTLPEGKRIDYALITPAMLLDTLDIDEAALREEYDRRASAFRRPERRLVERLVYRDAASAEAAMAQISDGDASFEDLVAERGLELEDTDMGDVTRDELGAAGAPVFALTEPGVTGPHETSLGPALFRVNAILPPQITEFEDAREELRQEVGADMAARLLAQQLDDYEDLLAGGASVADLAAETDMQGGRIDWRDISRDGIAAYAEFREAARAVQEGDFPRVEVLDNGGLFALEMIEALPSEPQVFDDVRDAVQRDWEQAQVTAALAGLAEDLRARAAAGESFAEMGFAPGRFPGVPRTHDSSDLPGDLVDLGFDLTEGEIAISPGDGRVRLVRVDAVIGPDRGDPDTQNLSAQIAAQLEQSLAQDVFAFFTSALQDGTSIRLNQSVIDAVNAEFQ